MASRGLVQTVAARDSTSRVSWCPTFFKFPKNLQLLLVYKNYRGTLSLHSMTGARSNNRIPFGQIAKCEFYRKKDSEGEMTEYFTFSNVEGQKVDFSVGILNFFTAEVKPVYQALTQMRIEHKFDLICHYLNLATRSKDFGLHRPEIYSVLGFRLDGTGVTKETLQQAGGSVGEYENFLQMATSSAHDPPKRRKKSEEDNVENNKKKARSGDGAENVPPVPMKETKVTDFFAKKESIKLTKVEEREKDFEEEINDLLGVEHAFVEGLYGRAEINIDQLSVSPMLGIQPNRVRVDTIKKSMMHRYDPTLCLMICPEDEENFDHSNLQSNRYHVISGCHCLKALKKIDEEGGLDKLKGLNGREIPCYILKTKCPITQNYGWTRSNDLQSTCGEKPTIYELLYIAESLTRDGVTELEMKAVSEKYAKTLMCTKADITALRKILNWKACEREVVVQVLKKYQSYCTLDATSTNNRTRLAKGLKMLLTSTLFCQLAKVDGKVFIEHSSLVLDSTISLSALVERLSEVPDLENNKAIVSKSANFKSIDDLKQKYPGKFDDQILGNYSGASVSSTSKNLPGIMLQKLVKNVLSESIQDGVVGTEIVDNINCVNPETLEKCDMIVCNVKKCPSLMAESLMMQACVTDKEALSVILILPTRKAQLWAINALETNKVGQDGDIRVEQLVFEKSKSLVTSDHVLENISFGLLFGKFMITSPPLEIFHGDVKLNLCNVVGQILVPGSTVAFVNDGNLPIIDIHSIKDLKMCNFTYFGEKKPVTSLKNRWKREKFPTGENEEDFEESAEEDIENGVEELEEESSVVPENKPKEGASSNSIMSQETPISLSGSD